MTNSDSTFRVSSTNRCPALGPITLMAEAIASAVAASAAITVTLEDVVSPRPVRGSRMCEYRVPSIVTD